MIKSTKIDFSDTIVWAAACAAQRINGDYIKVVTSYVTNEEILPDSLQTPAKQTNYTLVLDFLNNPDSLLEEDYDLANDIRSYYAGLTFKSLKTRLSDWERQVLKTLQKDRITDLMSFKTIIAIPASYFRSIEREKCEAIMRSCLPGFVANMNERVTVEGAVIKSFYSETWHVSFITIVTNDNHLVFFSHKKHLELGTKVVVTGRVKDHKKPDGNYTLQDTTQLNRVKVLVEAS